MKRPDIVPGTPQLMAAFGPLPHGSRTLVGILDGEPIGVVGLYPERGRMIMFSELKPPAKSYPQVILRTARTMLASIAHLQVPVHAKADPEIYGSARLLEHLGFVHLREDTYGRMS